MADRTDNLMYRILGPLEITGTSGQLSHIPRGRQQVVLSALLLEANRVVSTESLIDAIWGERPPSTARTQIQTCVSALRVNLAALGDHSRITTREPGYMIVVAPDRIDLSLFAALRDEARLLADAGRLDEASDRTRRAAGLWRGPALSGTRSSRLQSIAARLDEHRLINLETHIDLELRLGRHTEIVPELVALVNDHPLREGLRGRLMLALYRSGRQAEALEAFRSGRLILVEQLGIEPGDELRRLESAILAGDPELTPDRDPPPSGPAATAAPEGTPPERPPPERAVPFQLPPDIADFTARERLIHTAETLLRSGAGPTPVAVLTGPSGVGKSTLAIHLGHRLMGDYPDGQLYCDLGGNASIPLTALDVLGRFLRALGIPGSQLPETVDERAEMYRNLLADKRILILLDHARTVGQVRQLLPGTGHCGVLITGGSGVIGVPGARLLHVDVLGPEEAIDMLAAAIGAERVAAEPEAARALVLTVGGLPLALRIIAARLTARPNWSLEWMLDRLSDERRRLDELAHGELVIRSSLALTYDGLTDDGRRLLRLLSLHDGGTVPTWAAAALLDTDPRHAGDLLESLVDAQMLEVVGTGSGPGGPHYGLHSLVRLFAREERERHQEDSDPALVRLVGGWLALAEEAHRRLYGGDFTILHGDAPRWHLAHDQTDRLLRDPMAWLEAERDNLCRAVDLAADTGQAEACWDLAVTLVTLFESRCYYEEWQRTHLRALEAVRKAGLLRGCAALLCSVGSLCLTRSQLSAARQALEPALETFTALADTRGLALTRRNLALLARRRDDPRTALDLHQRAVAGFQAVADPVGRTDGLAHLARLALDEGRLDNAERLLDQALEVCHTTGSCHTEGQVRLVLSDLMRRRGRYQEAEELLREVLDVVRSRGDIARESRILHRLGKVSAQLGRISAARGLLRDVVAIRERILDRVGAAEARLELARLEAEHADEMRPFALDGRAVD
ncbi:BTAD domain-containing putative transcriptional regulator [Streptomyces sp. NPDC057638]|uniref:AfsR/SARP family transcriptional regulator n=1 Tax=Streptomyces sp. NPDC057638 TaxID=3346190 RepID=UPI0036BDF39A